MLISKLTKVTSFVVFVSEQPTQSSPLLEQASTPTLRSVRKVPVPPLVQLLAMATRTTTAAHPLTITSTAGLLQHPLALPLPLAMETLVRW